MIHTRYRTLLLGLLSALICVICGSNSSAASPALNDIRPRGAQRGTDAVLTFTGARLADAKEVIVYYPGTTAAKMEVVNDTTVKVTVKIAPDCRLGEHVYRLRTASGVSDMRTFWIGALPVADEKEPNNDFAAPQKIAFGSTVHGTSDTEDVDYYAFEAKKGQRLSVEIEGMRLATTLFDPFIAILDAKRFELATSDDAALLGQDGCVSVIAPADGTYFVQVRESAYGGNGACLYRLHVGPFPRPTAVVPAGGKLGEEVEVTFQGDPSGPIKQKIKLPATMPQEPFGVFCQDAGGISPSPLKFRLSEFGNVVEAEPNNDHATATPAPAPLPLAFNGVLDKPGDLDCFKFAAKKGEVYDVHCYARRIGSALDPVVYLGMFGAGDLVANDDAVGPDSYFRFTAPEDKEYVVRVADHLGKGGPNYHYRIEFTRVQPKLSITIPKVDFFGYTQERQTIPVPKGNRWAVLATATRGDFGGDLTLGTEGLPAGITFAADTMPANLNQMPVVFEARADAAEAGTLGQIVAAHVDAKTGIKGGWDQPVILTAVPNQGVYWTHGLSRAAFAVVEEAPFKIDVIEPKVPLVQTGAMNLKVVATRKAGFKAPITVFPLFNPPGVGSATSVVIPENATEALFALNANGAAQVRKWKTTLIASSDAGQGPIWVSSQLFNLEIAPPPVAIAMERAAVEQGKPTQMFCKVTIAAPFAGNARVKLVGVPAKVAAADKAITKDTKEFAFDIATEAASPAGIHKNLFCQVVIDMNGEQIVHSAGTSELRIDVPLPPKANAPPPPPTPAAPVPPAPANQPPPKRLTRLEQLRLEQDQREKASKGGAPATPPKK